jgi:hypothetical protein
MPSTQETSDFLAWLRAEAAKGKPLSEKGKYDLVSSSIVSILEAKTPKFAAWAKKVVKDEMVTYILDERKVAESTRARFAKLSAEKKH